MVIHDSSAFPTGGYKICEDKAVCCLLQGFTAQANDQKAGGYRKNREKEHIQIAVLPSMIMSMTDITETRASDLLMILCVA